MPGPTVPMRRMPHQVSHHLQCFGDADIMDYPRRAMQPIQNNRVTNMVFEETFMSNKQPNWPGPQQTISHPCLPNQRGRWIGDTSQQHAGQYLSAEAGSSFDHLDGIRRGNTHVGNVSHGQYTIFQGFLHPKKPEQTLSPSSTCQAGEVMNTQESPHALAQMQLANRPQHIKHELGLLTPISTNTQDSPCNEDLGKCTESSDDSNYQTAPSAPDTASGNCQEVRALATNDFTNMSTQDWEDQWWQDLEYGFDFLNPTIGDEEYVDSAAAALVPDETNLTQNIFDASWVNTNIASGPFQTKTTYPELDFEWLDMVPSGERYHYPSVSAIAPDAHDAGLAVLESACTNEALSSTGTIPHTPARMSQRDLARDQFLIQCKQRGMSYKEIKERGGFKEAESTLRGRYRTLTKPKEQRVRKPEWNDQDVGLLFQAIETFTGTQRQNFHQLWPNMSPSERRQKAPKVPWKRVAEYIALHGSYKYGNATVKKKFDELADMWGWLPRVMKTRGEGLAC